MKLESLARMFNRALAHTFEPTKNLALFVILFVSGLFFLFFQGFSGQTPTWMQGSFFFFPYFLSIALIAAAGVGLIRFYHHEIKNIPLSLNKLLSESWDLMITMACFLLPLLLAYLIIWLVLGIFLLLSQLPVLGSLFKIVLSFGPFLLQATSVLLVVAAALILFFVTPIVALKGRFDGKLITGIVTNRLKNDAFSNILLFLLACFPFWFLLKVAFLAFFLTVPNLVPQTDTVERILQMVFIIIPFVAILTPALVFFFNLAAEAHVWSVAQSDDKLP